MSYSEPLVNQLRIFFLSIGVGFVICSVYILVQAFFRIAGSKTWTVYLADVVFCLFTAVISFFFMVLYNNGRVRMHLFLGEAIGFFSLYLSVGRYVLRFLIGLSDVIHSLLLLLVKPYFMIFDSIKYGVKGLCSKIKNKKEKITKKFKNIGKIYLKNSDKSL